jgi:hypothetical protein
MQGLFNMASDSGLFKTDPAPGRVPLFEAKMTHQFDHRYGDYAMRPRGSRDTQLPDVPLEMLRDPSFAPLSRYWVDSREVEARLRDRWDHGWLIGWRDICRSTDERTLITTVIPRYGVGGLHLFLAPMHVDSGACIAANLNSLVLDYVARQKVGGTHLAFFIMEQLPVLPPSSYSDSCAWGPDSALSAWVTERVVELVYTSWDMQPFARDHGYDGPPFRWDPERRAAVRAELDAAFFHLYGLERDEVDYVIDTFPIVRRKDEQAHGEYRTKRLILEIYDELAEAIVTGRPYQTRLDPPPADPRIAHPPRTTAASLEV